MRKLSIVLALACVCSFGVSAAFAGPGCCKKDAATAKAVKETGKCSYTEAACAGEGEAFPTMAALVGDQKFECCDAATKAAEKANAKVKYVVNGKEFDCKDKAMAAYACAAECYAEGYMSVAYYADGKWKHCGSSCGGEKGASCGDKSAAKSCSHEGAAKTASAGGSACCKEKAGVKLSKEELAACCKKASKYRVAGHEYKSWDEASAASKKAHEAVKQMKMTYVVDGKNVDDAEKVCPTMKEAGKVEYMVAGEKMKCEMSAKVKMAKAMCEAAKKALDSAQARI